MPPTTAEGSNARAPLVPDKNGELRRAGETVAAAISAEEGREVVEGWQSAERREWG